MLWFTNIRGIQNIEHFSTLRGGGGGGKGGGARASGGANAPVYAIHHLMSVLLLLKFLSIFFESIRYHAIRVSGHAEIWSVRITVLLYYRTVYTISYLLLSTYLHAAVCTVSPFSQNLQLTPPALYFVHMYWL
jgi:hypothetical protein